MKIVAVAQARMGSQRLPGKVLKDLGGRPTLEWVVDAAKRAPGVDQVVVATSANPENNEIMDWCLANAVSCIRGSEDDVLDRYRLVVETTKADAIVRLTADCPMLDSRVIGEVIALYKSGKYDYASNIDPPTWPDGLDCEVVSARAILLGAQEATRSIDRDTVTRYIARNKSRFPAITLNCPLPGLQKERWVLDSPEDYLFLQQLVQCFPKNWKPDYLQILEALRKHPKLREINKKYARNERFFESLSQEPHYTRTFARSRAHFDRAIQTIPFASQTFSKSHIQYPSGTSPLFLSHGDGGYAFDIDGQDYVDLVSALLPNVLGYRDPDIDWAIRQQLNSGISFSLATELEAQLSEKLVEHIPSAEMVKFGKNGADVTAAAIRLARAHTGRGKIMLLDHCYHGWHDWSMASTERNAGIPAGERAMTERSNGALDRIKHTLSHERFAALILEPEGRSKEYLLTLKEICLATGTVLIFDEVITGFRWNLGGYQKYIGVTPDVSTFGKAMANGMPLSAIAGRSDLMKRFQPPDNIFYSGTFFGETLSLAASLATIKKMETEPVIAHLWKTGNNLRERVDKLIVKHDLEDIVSLYGESPRIHIKTKGFGNLSKDQVATLLRKEMIADGVLIISSHNICYAHGKPEIDRVVRAYDRAFGIVQQSIDSKDTNVVAAMSGVR